MAFTTLNSTPRADGFSMPAEWAAHKQTWMVWPERTDSWRLGAKPAQQAFVAVIKAIAGFEPVTVGASANQYANALVQLTDVFHPEVANRSMRRLYHHNRGYAYAVVLQSN